MNIYLKCKSEGINVSQAFNELMILKLKCQDTSEDEREKTVKELKETNNQAKQLETKSIELKSKLQYLDDEYQKKQEKLLQTYMNQSDAARAAGIMEEMD